jgi:ABC-type branched-subunit amino acid transport system substrate-binding protein
MNGDTKIGILIPQSGQYPTLDRDFMRGIKLNNLNAKFCVESIGIAADEQQILEKIQKLNFQEDVSIIIGFFGHYQMDKVYDYVSNNDILLIASDLGATMPYGISKKKGVYINSYALVESCHLLGEYLLKNNHRKIASATSYYDSGYGMLSAIESSFNGDIGFTGHYVTPFQPRENEAECMDETITSNNPDAVFAFYSGLFAEENAQFVEKNKLTQKYPFYVTPFFVNERIIEGYKNTPYDLNIVGSWMQNDADAGEFTKEYIDAYGDAPSVFSLLGYEGGLIIKNLLINTGGDVRNSVLIKEISNLNIAGPRGELRFDEATNRTIFNHYIYKLNIDPQSNIRYEKIDTLENKGEFIKAVTSYNEPLAIGGWQNAYLCH